MSEPYTFGQSRKSDVLFGILENQKQEEVHTSKTTAYKRIRGYPNNHLTTNTYVDSEIFDCRFYERKIFQIINQHATNGLLFKILACIDPSLWVEIKSETSLAAGLNTYEWDSEPWAFVKVQVMSAVSDTPAKVQAYLGGQN